MHLPDTLLHQLSSNQTFFPVSSEWDKLLRVFFHPQGNDYTSRAISSKVDKLAISRTFFLLVSSLTDHEFHTQAQHSVNPHENLLLCHVKYLLCLQETNIFSPKRLNYQVVISNMNSSLFSNPIDMGFNYQRCSTLSEIW